MSKVELRKKIGSKTFCWEPADPKWGYKGDIGMWWLEEGGKLIRPAKPDEYQKLSKVEKMDSQSKGKESDEDDEDNGPMGYDKASKIRKKSFGDLLSEKIVDGGGIGESLKSTFSEKGKAKIKGIKEFFDPMNMAKAVGGKAGAAIYGKLRGRSQEDMEYFTDTKKRKKGGTDANGTPTADKLDSLETGNDFLSTLISIQELLSKHEEENKAQREKENNFAEENKTEKDRRHNELIAAITGKPVAKGKEKKETATKEDDDSGFGLNPHFKINPARALAKEGAKDAVVAAEKVGAKTATKVGKDVIKKSALKTLGKSIGKGALKSIPILGAVMGAGFAISRLIDGDVVGAGIEAASGLGSALTSIPLTITNAARDVYKSVYGDFPDPTDPQDQKNLSEIYDICKEVAAELLKSASVDKTSPGEMQYDEMGNATGYATPEPTTAPKTSGSATPASSAPSSPAPAAPSSPAPASTASPTASPNVGQALNSAQSQNLDLQATPSSTDPSTVINNSKTISSKQTGKKESIPSVRNAEPTFQRMIFNSTRVV